MEQIDPTAGGAVVHPSVTEEEAQFLRVLFQTVEQNALHRTDFTADPHREEPGRLRLTCPLSLTFPAGHVIHSWRAGYARGAVDAFRALRGRVDAMREQCARWLLEDAPQLTTDTPLLDELAARVRCLPLEEPPHGP